MNNEILNLKISNRILESDGPIFSGEAVNIRLAIDAADAVAAKHKLVLFGFDKGALAESAAFSATENQGVWSSSINTATNEFAAYFRNIPANASKSVGAMIVNTETGDTITRGNIAVISTPFPSELTPAPTPFEFVSKEEMQAAINEAESSLSASFESGLSSLASDVASKAESSTVADLSDIVSGVEGAVDLIYATLGDVTDELGYVHNGLDELSSDVATKADADDLAALGATVATKADAADLANKANAEDVMYLSSDVADLSSAVASKADSSTVADLAAEVAALPYKKKMVTMPPTLNVPITLQTRTIHAVKPRAQNESLTFRFPAPDGDSIFDAFVDLDNTDGGDLTIILDDANYAFWGDYGYGIGSGDIIRYHFAESAFIEDGKPVMLVRREQP